MLDSIQIGSSGLQAYTQGLRVIAHNTANLHTTAYKAQGQQFAELVDPATGQGHGLAAAGTRTDRSAGESRQTGRASDLALEGDGYFVLRDAQGRVGYTRDGSFRFDGEGRLVAADGAQVQGLDAGQRTAVSIAGRATDAGTPTTTLQLGGNLSSTADEQTVGGLAVVDGAGRERSLSLRLVSTATTEPGTWRAELLEAGQVVGQARLRFVDGRPDDASARIAITYQAAGAAAQPLVLALGSDVTSFASGSLSTLSMASQDGRPPGALTQAAFDAAGVLRLTYSNGRTVQATQLLLVRPRAEDALQSTGSGRYALANGGSVTEGVAGGAGFGSLRAGALETSNVDLSREFSELVVVQRGYQASSQVIATANDMLQELFNMKKP